MRFRGDLGLRLDFAFGEMIWENMSAGVFCFLCFLGANETAQAYSSSLGVEWDATEGIPA